MVEYKFQQHMKKYGNTYAYPFSLYLIFQTFSNTITQFNKLKSINNEKDNCPTVCRKRCFVCVSSRLFFESRRKTTGILWENAIQFQQPWDLGEKHSPPSPDGRESIILQRMLWRLKLLVRINMGTISQIDLLAMIRYPYSIN